METMFEAVLALGVVLMGLSLYLGKRHEAGRRYVPQVRRALFWACAAFMMAFAVVLAVAGFNDSDAYRFVMGAVVAYLTVLFVKSEGGPAFTEEGRFPFSAVKVEVRRDQ